MRAVTGDRVTVSSLPLERVDTRARSPRVAWRTRWRFARAARLDRRAGLPLGLSAETTPVLAEIVARFNYAAERERTAYLADEQFLAVERHRLEARRRSLAELRDRLDQELDRQLHPTEGSWLEVRYPGEEDLSPAATRTRRAVTHLRAVEAAEARKRHAQAQMDDVLLEVADVEARMRRRAEVARSRVLRHRELGHREAAIYRRFLLRRHPERSALIGRWTTDLCLLPDWAARIAPLPSESSSQPDTEVFA